MPTDGVRKSMTAQPLPLILGSKSRRPSLLRGWNPRLCKLYIREGSPDITPGLTISSQRTNLKTEAASLNIVRHTDYKFNDSRLTSTISHFPYHLQVAGFTKRENGMMLVGRQVHTGDRSAQCRMLCGSVVLAVERAPHNGHERTSWLLTLFFPSFLLLPSSRCTGPLLSTRVVIPSTRYPMHRLFPTHALSNVGRSAPSRGVSGAAWLQRHSDIRTRFNSRSLTNGANRPPRRRQYTPEELLQHKKQAEAVSGELPSSPVGPSTGFGGFGGGGNGMRDAILTTVFGVVVCEYLSFSV